MKETKVPKGYRLAKLSEFIKKIEEGYKLKKDCWYCCENFLKDKTKYSGLGNYWNFGYRLLVIGDYWIDDGHGHSFGVFIEK